MWERIRFFLVAIVVCPWVGCFTLSCATLLFTTVPICSLLGFTNMKRFIQRKVKAVHAHGLFASLNFLSGGITDFHFYIPSDVCQEEHRTDKLMFHESNDTIWTIEEHRLRYLKLVKALERVRDDSLDSVVSLVYPTRAEPLEGTLERDILISNHQIYTDWIYVWHFVQRLGRSEDLSILLKASVRSIPLVGQGIDCIDFIFLKRKWAEDRAHLLERLASLIDHCPLMVMIFPEGTTMSQSAIAASHDYCKKHDLQKWDHVLYPRTTGLHAIIDVMGPSLNGIYDLTIGLSPFGKSVWTDPSKNYCLANSFFGLQVPRHICFFVDYVPLSKVPAQQPKELSNWLLGRFSLKESLLKAFETSMTEQLLGTGKWTLFHKGPMIVPYFRATLLLLTVNVILWFLMLRMFWSHLYASLLRCSLVFHP